EMVAELFPGGTGRLRRVDLGQGPRPFAGQDGDGAEGQSDEDLDDEIAPPDEDGGVEIEVTPAGKSTRRLSLLSGGEKSLVSLAPTPRRVVCTPNSLEVQPAAVLGCASAVSSGEEVSPASTDTSQEAGVNPPGLRPVAVTQ